MRACPDQKNIKIGKAGRSRWLGRRPHTRGVVKNPVDHPHGGGEGKTAGGVLLTDTAIEQASIATNICKVIAVGPDAYMDKDKFPNGAWCKKDDWIIITKYAGARLSIDGGELRIINDDEVLAVVEDPRDILPANLM